MICRQSGCGRTMPEERKGGRRPKAAILPVPDWCEHCGRPRSARAAEVVEVVTAACKGDMLESCNVTAP